MIPCPRCGTPVPAEARILPLGIEMEQVFSCTPKPLLIGEIPDFIPWLCPGTRESVDAGFLRFGIIALTSGICWAPRFTRWCDATRDLQHRAIEARALRLMVDGLI